MTHPDQPSDALNDVPEAAALQRTCTASQLRRFIRSRSYVPLHELRRRFELNGEADDVSMFDTPDGLVFMGLPERESRMLQELHRQNDIGFELCKDPPIPVVIGVYPMRPVLRT
jgi:hypothetical protein